MSKKREMGLQTIILSDIVNGVFATLFDIPLNSYGVGAAGEARQGETIGYGKSFDIMGLS